MDVFRHSNLHQEQKKGQHQPGVRGVTEYFTEPGRKVCLQGLLNYIKHAVFPTAEKINKQKIIINGK